MTGATRWLASAAAIARRDLIIEWSYQFQVFLRFVQVLVLTAILFFVGKLVDSPPELAEYGGEYFEFTVIGFAVGAFGAASLSGLGQTVSAEQRIGTLESLLVSPSSVSAVLSGALVVPFGLTLVQIGAYLGIAVGVFDADLRFGDAPAALLLLTLTIVTFCALGLVSAGFIILTKRGDPLTAFAAQSSALLAGGLFPTDLLPAPLEALTRAVPAYWGMEGLRRVVLNDAELTDVTTEVLVLVGFVVVMVPAALAFLRWSLGVARRTGTLGTY